MSRRIRPIIPTTEAKLQPKVLDLHIVKEKLRLKQQNQKHYFDQHTGPLPGLDKGDQNRVSMGRSWEPGVVIMDHTETARSYNVQTKSGGE